MLLVRFGLVYVSGSCGVCICVVLGGDCLRLACRPGGCAAHGLVGFCVFLGFLVSCGVGITH